MIVKIVVGDNKYTQKVTTQAYKIPIRAVRLDLKNLYLRMAVRELRNIGI